MLAGDSPYHSPSGGSALITLEHYIRRQLSGCMVFLRRDCKMTSGLGCAPARLVWRRCAHLIIEQALGADLQERMQLLAQGFILFFIFDNLNCSGRSQLKIV